MTTPYKFHVNTDNVGINPSRACRWCGKKIEDVPVKLSLSRGRYAKDEWFIHPKCALELADSLIYEANKRIWG